MPRAHPKDHHEVVGLHVLPRGPARRLGDWIDRATEKPPTLAQDQRLALIDRDPRIPQKGPQAPMEQRLHLSSEAPFEGIHSESVHSEGVHSERRGICLRHLRRAPGCLSPRARGYKTHRVHRHQAKGWRTEYPVLRTT